jgi:hypothetical protein
MIKLEKTEYVDVQEMLDEVQKKIFDERDTSLDDEFDISEDYLDYFGRRIGHQKQTFVGNNQEHAILECLYDAIKNGKTLSVKMFHQQPKCKNIKMISVCDRDNKLHLVFEAMDQGENS